MPDLGLHGCRGFDDNAICIDLNDAMGRETCHTAYVCCCIGADVSDSLALNVGDRFKMNDWRFAQNTHRWTSKVLNQFHPYVYGSIGIPDVINPTAARDP